MTLPQWRLSVGSGALTAGMLILSLALSLAAQPKQALVIDGNLGDDFWRDRAAQELVPSPPGVATGVGGDLRAAVVGRYLCRGSCDCGVRRVDLANARCSPRHTVTPSRNLDWGRHAAHARFRVGDDVGDGSSFGSGSAQMAWSTTGTFMYVAGEPAGDVAPVQWLERTGRVKGAEIPSPARCVTRRDGVGPSA